MIISTKIEEAQVKIQQRWDEFESKWMGWSAGDLVLYVRHVINWWCDRDSGVDFGKIERALINADLNGASIPTITRDTVLNLFVIRSVQNIETIYESLRKLIQKYPPKVTVIAAKEAIALKSGAPVRIPRDYVCPLMTSDVCMVDPVISLDGITYERKNIETFVKGNTNPVLSPQNRQPLTTKAGKCILVPNDALKAEIEAFRVKHNLSKEGEQ